MSNAAAIHDLYLFNVSKHRNLIVERPLSKTAVVASGGESRCNMSVVLQDEYAPLPLYRQETAVSRHQVQFITTQHHAVESPPHAMR